MKMNSRGFTIIETVMATGLSTMILVCLMSILMASTSGWHKGFNRNTSTETANLACQRLANDLRDGKSATVASGILTVAIPGIVTDGMSGDTMYDLSTTASYRNYLVYNSNLVRRVLGVDTIIAKNIDSVTFTVQGGTVGIVLRSTSRSGGKNVTEEVRSRVLLRNYR